ncbi:hypothetical protein OZ410_02940 [Robiginitalea sp. M366]|uniref:hypothetical protein n=1 Tax=Robiginitalea aestuariiviva TaxID=3036903 RepID=UPI00240D86DC|nr:hypothetical protein [Robiginitalea aestuariiviva]MDG1571254.1 hypothetical protein [Robiginitalea aestuariiviva]
MRSSLVMAFLGGFLLTGCGSARTEDRYAAAWQGVLESSQWQASVSDPEAVVPAPDSRYYALPEVQWATLRTVSPEFMELYPKLVSRAYFRLIADALNSDRRVTRAYQRVYLEAHQPRYENDRAKQEELEVTRRRFLAHRRMLEGLRNWKSFNPYGSDDLDFFLREQMRPAFAMHQKGAGNRRIVEHLMRNLADLYHLQGEGQNPPTD